MPICQPLARRWKPGALVLGAAIASVASLLPADPALAQSAPAATSAAPLRGLPDFADLAEQVGPSVVNIRTTEKVSPGQPNSQEEQMLEFFRRFGLPVPPGASPRGPRQNRGPEERPRGVGSGFVLSADGTIMTNAHVVEGAEEVIVTLTDKREFKAKVIGADKRSDVAVVKIAASGLQPVRIGDIGRLRVGEWVMAIGSPFGLESTVTAGIVSAKQRETGDYLPFIQTDVAINPGNSGGPLINLRGEVVGINSQIYSRSGGFQGISFAIPIDEAVRVSDQLRASGKVTRGRIGVSIAGVDPDIAESLGLKKAEGALVRGVEDGSPAAKAGVEAGDIIVRFDGKAVEKSADLPRLVGNTKPGAKVGLTVWRRGAYKDLRLTVASLEEEKVAKAAAKSSGAAQALGLTLRELGAEERAELKLRGGVVVVEAGGAAARAGLAEGDVILAVANREIMGLKDFEAALASLDKGRAVNLLMRRGDWVQYVVIRPNSR
ncbi:Do family serine endopeptidase [Malikia sp.]|uniref:Do family serine endopeptidase n=1 Tax=Malikia sp. TaxID=2070706 RepID=UPI00260B6D41|nr:Do family serine endopeptidase [Malikia sp.]MDD2727604.1 Do family serine endopeptidase [Malikia sp.]